MPLRRRVPQSFAAAAATTDDAAAATATTHDDDDDHAAPAVTCAGVWDAKGDEGVVGRKRQRVGWALDLRWRGR